MTTEEKLLKLRKLADAMYYAAQHLTTDASRLHKAMDEYHQFIINEYHKEATVSEDLEKVTYQGEEYIRCYQDELDEFANKYPKTVPPPEKRYAKYSDVDMVIAVKAGANWQKTKGQSIIELAEDHAMLAGMEKMKEQMMKEAVDGTVFTQLEDGEIMVRSHYFKSEKFNYLDEVKLIIIKEE